MDQRPIYVKLDEFDEIYDVISDLRKKIDEARKKFQELRSLKEKEEDGLREWEERMDNVTKFLDKMDSLLNSP